MAKKFPQPSVVLHMEEDGVYIVISRQCWGKGTTLAVANSLCYKSGGRPDEEWAIYSAHKDTRLDEMGRMCYPKEHPPILLCYSPPSK